MVNYITTLKEVVKAAADQLNQDADTLKQLLIREKYSHATSSNHTKEEEAAALQKEHEQQILQQEKEAAADEEDEYEDLDEVKKPVNKKVKGKGKTTKGGKIVKKDKKSKKSTTTTTNSLSQSVSLVKDVLVGNKEALIFLAASTLAYFYGEVFSV